MGPVGWVTVSVHPGWAVPVLWPASLAQWQTTRGGRVEWVSVTSPRGAGTGKRHAACCSVLGPQRPFSPLHVPWPAPCTTPASNSVLSSCLANSRWLTSKHAMQTVTTTSLLPWLLYLCLHVCLWLQGQWVGAQHNRCSTNGCVIISHSKVPKLMNDRAKIEIQCLTLGPVFKECVPL